MSCEFKLEECKKIDAAIDSLFDATRYLVEDLHYKQEQTGELIKYSDSDRENSLKSVLTSRKDLKQMFNACGCIAKPVKDGLGEIFGKTVIESKYD